MSSFDYQPSVSLMTVDGALHILRAEPEALFSRELVDDMRGREDSLYTLSGNLLKIYAVDRTVIYRLTATPDGRYYTGVWPD